MNLSWKERLLYATLTLAVLGLVVVYALEIYYFKRTFNPASLFIGGGAVGLVLGLFAGRRFSRTAEDAVERIQVYLFFTALTVIFTPLLASLSNRWLSPHPPRAERVIFFEEKPYRQERFGLLFWASPSDKPRGYYVFFMRDGKLERIDNRAPLSPPLKSGDSMEILVRKGLWGVEWVE
jgi:hypothetical protein